MGHVTFKLQIKAGKNSAAQQAHNHITSGYNLQANGLVEHQKMTMEDCIRRYMEESQHWLELLDRILFSVHITKHCSTK